MMNSSISSAYRMMGEDWKVTANQTLNVSITPSLENANAVILFIHGGPELSYEAAIKTQEPFFSDLAEKKFHVIAPYHDYNGV